MSRDGSMHPAYFETCFRLHGPAPEWPDAFAIVSAWATTEESWSRERSQAADAALEIEVRNRSTWVVRITGFSPTTSHIEPSWAAALSLDEACDLGLSFLQAELPFMATETILMETVRRGGDRQELHEVIRRCSMEAASRVKLEGCDNDLLERLAAEPAFQSVKDDLDSLCDPSRFVGRAPEQVEEYLAAEIDPLLAEHEQAIAGLSGEVRV
jgi:hypothetical protein